MSKHRRSIRARFTAAAAIVAVALLTAWELIPARAADDGRITSAPVPERNPVQFRFVKLAEQNLGDQRLTVLIAKPGDGAGAETQFMMSPDSAALALARTLKDGDAIAVTWVVEHGVKWLSSVEKSAAADPSKMTAEQLVARVKELSDQNAQLQAQVKDLQARLAAEDAVIADLRKQPPGGSSTPPPTTTLTVRPPVAQSQPGDEAASKAAETAAPLPEGTAGFRGVFIGTLESKDGRVFTMKVTKIGSSSTTSKATKPEALVGQTITLYIPEKSAGLIRDLDGLKVGDSIVGGAANEQGNIFTVYNILMKGDRIPTFG